MHLLKNRDCLLPFILLDSCDFLELNLNSFQFVGQVISYTKIIEKNNRKDNLQGELLASVACHILFIPVCIRENGNRKD